MMADTLKHTKVKAVLESAARGRAEYRAAAGGGAYQAGEPWGMEEADIRAAAGEGQHEYHDINRDKLSRRCLG
jgi:hypothetical protein